MVKAKTKSKNSLHSLKRKNRQEVLDVLRTSGPRPISELTLRTKLSKATVTNIIDFFLSEGLVLARGKGASGEDGGKRPVLYAFNPDYRSVFCVKIDEDHMLAALTNLEGKIIASHGAFYDSGTSLDRILGLVRETFRTLIRRQDFEVGKCAAAVVGIHGVIDSERGVCFISPHFSGWGTDIPFRDRIAAFLPDDMPVYVDNWIHYHAYGEIRLLPKKVDRFFLIGTDRDGLGGGLIIDGRIYRGFGSLAGEIGHIVVDFGENAALCTCGGSGCFEASVAHPRLLARAKGEVKKHRKSTLHSQFARNGEIAFADVAEAADAGDAFARTVIDWAAGYFALAVNNIMQVCDPELVLIQGAYAQAGRYFLESVAAKIQKVSLLGIRKNLQIAYSQLGDEGTIIGAGYYAADEHFATID